MFPTLSELGWVTVLFMAFGEVVIAFAILPISRSFYVFVFLGETALGLHGALRLRSVTTLRLHFDYTSTTLRLRSVTTLSDHAQCDTWQ
ncbi:hypothetical protein [Winogradskyella sp.]|uniref:hypothetical protein n=1 Tax=Winogradskyella sp. TaxID=1883156 RepID=UPI001B113A93|nr:hypothetical protein [Winogradskyella sp.]MBO6880898.1 hypothetical protein [Winogradskyella sp.]